MPKRLLFGFALALSAVTAPSFGVIIMRAGEVAIDEVDFERPFFELDNTPLTISGRAYASSLFVGQGWSLSADKDPVLDVAWEAPVGGPTFGSPLALFGQYPPLGNTPRGPSPAVDDTKYQNVASFGGGSTGFPPRFGGMVDNYYFGVTSILFLENIDAISLRVLDAGVNEGDGLGGPVFFSFYEQTGEALGCQRTPTLGGGDCELAQAVDGFFAFRSDSVDIAGIQVWHQDPRGLEFSTLRFGVPTPSTFALLPLGLAGLLIWSRRRLGSVRALDRQGSNGGANAPL